MKRLPQKKCHQPFSKRWLQTVHFSFLTTITLFKEMVAVTVEFKTVHYQFILNAKNHNRISLHMNCSPTKRKKMGICQLHRHLGIHSINSWTKQMWNLSRLHFWEINCWKSILKVKRNFKAIEKTNSRQKE